MGYKALALHAVESSAPHILLSTTRTILEYWDGPPSPHTTKGNMLSGNPDTVPRIKVSTNELYGGEVSWVQGLVKVWSGGPAG